VRSTTPPLPTVPTPLPRLPQFVEASLSCGGGAGAGAGRPVEMVPTHAVVMGVGHGRAHRFCAYQIIAGEPMIWRSCR